MGLLDRNRYIIVPNNKKVEIPRVTFWDRASEKLVDDWLCQGSDKKSCGSNLSKRFGYLLKLAGIDSTETCSIRLDQKQLFKCYLKNAKDEAWMELIERGGEDLAEFEISYHNRKKKFIYSPARKDGEVLFQPYNCKIENHDNKSTLIRNFNESSSLFSVLNGEYNFSLAVVPKSGVMRSNLSSDYNQESSKNYVYVLPNEQDLADYLLGLSFPCAIEEVYKKINRLSLKDIEAFSHIALEIKKKEEEKEIKTDAIKLVDGTWSEFTKTSAGETISLDHRGNFTYQGELVELKNGILTTHTPIKKISEDMMISPIEELKKIEGKVQKVKKIARDTFPSK